jgi:hypothetical protein
MKLTDKQTKKALLIGGLLFIVIRYRDVWFPKKPLDADGKDDNAINRAVNSIINGSVKVSSTPPEITNGE